MSVWIGGLRDDWPSGFHPSMFDVRLISRHTTWWPELSRLASRHQLFALLIYLVYLLGWPVADTCYDLFSFLSFSYHPGGPNGACQCHEPSDHVLMKIEAVRVSRFPQGTRQWNRQRMFWGCQVSIRRTPSRRIFGDLHSSATRS